MKFKLFVPVLILLAASCQIVPQSMEDVASAPIVRFGDDVLQDALLIKFNAPLPEEGLIGLEASQGVSLERVLPSTPGKEALEAQFGLDRWYEAHITDGTDVGSMAVRMSRLPSVAVQTARSILHPIPPPGLRMPLSTTRIFPTNGITRTMVLPLSAKLP